ncbi:MAG: YCF48-related protein, partial [Myxococcota bacterium]
ETVRGKGIDTLLALWVGRGLEVAVGRHGLMQLKRGHDPWEVVSLPKLPPQAELTAVDFKHGRFGWITSSTGEIYRTEDGGRTWNSTRPEPQTRWTTIAALDPLNVFVGGVQGALSTSSDRGTRWNPVEWPLDNTQVGVPDIMTIAITSRDSAVDVWLGADRGLLLRKDPQRLAFAPVDLGLRNGISDLEAVDERLWLLDQSGMVLRQDGRDQPWRVIALDPGAAIVDIAWSTGDLGLATLESGALVRTTDGGHTWEVLNQPAEALIADLVGVAKATFVAVGHGGTIQRTTDGGLHWTLLPKKVGQALNAVCRDGDLLVACGFSGACLSSPDQGASWKLWEGAPKGLGKGHVTAMDTTPHGTMALGGVGGVWLRGPEGGWTHLAPSAEAGPLREIRRIKLRPDGTLAVIAATGDLWHAVDGHLEPVAMPATGKGDQPRVLDMAWSADDTVLVSLNRGLWELSWPPGPKPAWNARPEALHRVTQAPIRRLSTDLRGRVWLLGPGGIWASGVETAWVQPLAALPARPLDMAFASSTLGYAACDGGVILRTEDGGTSWVAEHTGTRSTLTAIDLRPDLKVTAIGHGGVI